MIAWQSAAGVGGLREEGTRTGSGGDRGVGTERQKGYWYIFQGGDDGWEARKGHK